jgi:formate-dependent nitrite reductase membrane component NrfD
MSPVGLPDTFFTAAPDWRWFIIAYFFVGGLAGGSYMLAVLIDLFGDTDDRPLAGTAYGIAFAAVALSGVFLTADLGRPERFWHMMLQSKTGWPMLKMWSPMSLGAWGLLFFGGVTFLSLLAALAEAGRLPWRGLVRLRPPGALGVLVAVVGGLLGFFVAGYTGILLSVTNRPIWADTWLLGLAFLVSAASISAALLILVGQVHGRSGRAVRALGRFDRRVLPLELVVLVALVASLGPVARVWLSVWGAALLAVVLIGIIAPIALLRRGHGAAAPAAVLVLVGGFLLRVVIVLSSEFSGRV